VKCETLNNGLLYTVIKQLNQRYQRFIDTALKIKKLNHHNLKK